MQTDLRYLLATYVDGPYAKSALELVLYPTGCSFYRPFSYRRDYAGSSISATPSDAKILPSGFIGARFLDQQAKGTRGFFVPLRRIHAIQIRESDGFHVQFRLGEFIQHAERGRFLTFDLSQKLRDEFAANNDILLTTLPAQFADELAGRLHPLLLRCFRPHQSVGPPVVDAQLQVTNRLFSGVRGLVCFSQILPRLPRVGTSFKHLRKGVAIC